MIVPAQFNLTHFLKFLASRWIQPRDIRRNFSADVQYIKPVMNGESEVLFMTDENGENGSFFKGIMGTTLELIGCDCTIFQGSVVVSHPSHEVIQAGRDACGIREPFAFGNPEITRSFMHLPVGFLAFF
jgi:hypothetical protein